MANKATSTTVTTKFPSVTIKQMWELLDIGYHFADKPGMRKNFLFCGEMGIGKSQAVIQWAKSKDFNVIFDFRGAVQTPEDMTGMPRIVDHSIKDADGKIKVLDIRTFWAKPEWIPTDPKAKMLLIFEELNRAPKDVQQAVFQAVLDNRIHTHEFPLHTQIVALINPPDSSYQVDKLDIAMHDRFANFTLQPDPDMWMQWMYKQGGDPRVIQLIATYPELLCQVSEEPPSPTARGWKEVSDVLLSGLLSDNAIAVYAAGRVGPTAAATFREFIDHKFERPVMGKDILGDYAKVKAKLEVQKNDKNAVTAKELRALLSSKKSLNQKEFDNLKRYLLDTKKDGTPICPAEFRQLIIEGLPDSLMFQLSQVDELVDVVATVSKKVKQLEHK